ncbi:MAG: MOSC domain-containing protein [Raineya sp.]
MKALKEISELWIYPIKSLGGIQLSEAVVSDRGFQHDRRWMLVDEAGKFLSQREYPNLALLQVNLKQNGLQVFLKNKSQWQIEIPFLEKSNYLQVQIWDDTCEAWQYPNAINEFFSDYLGQKVRLVYMPESSRRQVESNYAKNGEITSFSDGYPFLLIGQSSLDDLNNRLPVPVPMNRFRPNIVFVGADAFEEDSWESFKIGNIEFFCTKPCARCVVTTISQETAEPNKEPLKTLSTYRKFGNKILFGQNLLHKGEGSIRLKDTILDIKKGSVS